MRCGLLPISQFSFHFYENIGYHDYKSLALDANHDEALSQDLGENKALMLKNHGTLTVGATLHEALFYSIYLEKACKVQVALSNVSDLNLPSPAICMKARNDMRNFEADLGKRDWLALIRELERDNSNYKD
jgi:ribulose-5-phosphate 4-epimerase/fuculose-1-phosphate aldolase